MSVPRLRRKLARGREGAAAAQGRGAGAFRGQPTRQEAIGELARRIRLPRDRGCLARHRGVAARRAGRQLPLVATSPCSASIPVKIITTGEGGMALTNDAVLAAAHGDAAHAWHHARGGTFEASSLVRAAPGTTSSRCSAFNYRMTDIQAALGIEPARRASTHYRRAPQCRSRGVTMRALRNAAAAPVVQAGQRLGVPLVCSAAQGGQAPGKSRRQVFEELRRRGIGADVHYMPVHLQPYYRALGFLPGQFPRRKPMVRRVHAAVVSGADRAGSRTT